MLTKEHLRLKARGKSLKVDFLDPDYHEVRLTAAGVIELMQQQQGQTLVKVEAAMADRFPKDKVAPALGKLVLDKSGIDDTADFSQIRGDYLQLSEKLRRDGVSDLDEFQVRIEQAIGKPFLQVAGEVYGDLPQYRTLHTVADVDPLWLINRYNLAQVQGALLQCLSLTLKLPNPGQNSLRSLLRAARFHRLLVEFEQTKKALVMEFAGPSSVLGQSTAYGVRLANVFLTIAGLTCPWQLEAKVRYKQKERTLKLTSEAGVQGVKGQTYDRVPEDVAKFVTSFNEQAAGYVAEVGSELKQIGDQLSFPDFCFRHPDGRIRYLEVFPKTHIRQFIQRVEAAAQVDADDYMVAVAQPLMKQAEVADLCANSPWFQKYGMTFRSFPNTKMVGEVLSHC